MSTVYIWITLMGIIGITSLILFLNFFIRFFKMNKRKKRPEKVLGLTWSLLLISIISFSLTIYFIIDIKEQLLQIL